MNGRMIVAGTLACVVAGAGACSQGPKGSRHSGGGGLRRSGPAVAGASASPAAADVGTPGAESYGDPVSRNLLREKALVLLTQAAETGRPEERANAIEALQTTPGRLYRLLDPALVDENDGVRAVAAMTIGRARIRAASHKVTPLVSDRSPMLRAAALYALKRCEQPVDLTPLGEMLRDPSPRVRAQAAFLLGDLGETSALAMLREAAAEPMPKADLAERRIMELQIAEACVKLGDDLPLADIRTALFPARPEDLEGTALACQIVGQIRDEASVKPLMLLTAMWDRNQRYMPAEVRLAAAGALAKMGQKQAGFIADEYRSDQSEALRAQSAHVYGATGLVENLAVLAALMEDPSGRVRVAAAAGIVRITETEASESPTAGRG